jgi:hypothetical protein
MAATPRMKVTADLRFSPQANRVIALENAVRFASNSDADAGYVVQVAETFEKYLNAEDEPNGDED